MMRGFNQLKAVMALAAMIEAATAQENAIQRHFPGPGLGPHPLLPGAGGGYRSGGRSSGGNGYSPTPQQRIKAAKAAKLSRRRNRRAA